METREQRKSKRLTRSRQNLKEASVLDNMEPVAASSPKNIKMDDPEAESAIKQAREKLEEIKKEISRSSRLARFRLGSELLQQPFSKELFAKNIFECHQKTIGDKTATLTSGFSVLSLTNLPSSSENQSVQDKSSSRNKRLTNRKTCGKKEVTFKDDGSHEMSKTRRFINTGKTDLQSKNNDTKSGEWTSSSSSSSKLTKKTGSHAVALVTPGPDADKPMSVLRRPTAGELAVSLFGSPLLVAPDYAPTSMPQINLPTADGKVVAILPRDGFTVDDLPIIATPTRYQLKTLNKYLNDLCHQQVPKYHR